jgi:putative sterol carrier protein
MTTNINLDQFFKHLEQNFQVNNPLEDGTTIQYYLSGTGGGQWFTTFQGQKCQVQSGTTDHPDAFLDTSAEDFIGMLTGSPEEIGWAFIQGRFNMSGNIATLWRVLALLREEQKKLI